MVLEMKFEMEKYMADTFAPYVGQVFSFESADAARKSVQLELVEVKRHKSGARPQGFREPFALLFTAQSPESFASASLRILHDDFAPSEWFVSRVLVPGADPRVAYYEAVFG